MNLENNILDELLEKARDEQPQLSYEEVAQSFISNSSPTLLAVAKSWFVKHISLNSILLLTVGGVSIGLLWTSFTPENKTEFSQNLPAVTKSIIATSSPKEIEKTVSLVEIETKAKPISKEEKKEVKKKIEITTSDFSKLGIEKTTRTIVQESPILESSNIHKVESIKIPSEEKSLINPTSSISENVIAEKTERPSMQRMISNPTIESPWVVGDGATNPEWGIVKMNANRIFSEKEIILKKIFDLYYLNQIFEKDDHRRTLPLTIVSNFQFLSDTWIEYQGAKVRVIEEPFAPEFNPKNPFIDITKFRIKKKKATLRFKYNNHSVFIQLKKNGSQWEYHKLKAKKGNNKLVDITF